MSVEVLQIITLILFVLSGAFFVIAVCLFFAFNVPGIVGNLSGMTAKRAIGDIKARNEAGHTGPLRQGKTIRKLNKGGKTAALGKKLGETVRLEAVDTAAVRETTVLTANREEVNLTRPLGELPMFTVDVDIVLCESTEEII